jgi:hypothetical protein
MRDGNIYMTAGEALGAHRLVKISGSTVIYNDKADPAPLFVTASSCNSGEKVELIPTHNPGTLNVTFLDASCSAGAALYTAADGKLSTTSLGATLKAYALEAGVAGQFIEVIFLP